MLKYLAASLALAFVAAGVAPAAEAARAPVIWGTNDTFDEIAPLTVPDEAKSVFPAEWRNGAQLTHHSESFVLFWVVGLWLTDKGYAVHVPGSQEYWDITEEEVKEFQSLKLLPAALPDTAIKPMTWLAAFWGWGAILIGLGVAYYIKSKI
jgi:hypothetical protein